ncbi:MAG: hypothetical protein ACXAEU_23695 [Candidatus Hodarchaeales archaeon]|jgi:hypothetical protein
MKTSVLLSEERIIRVVGDYLRANYYITEEELVINSTVLDLQELVGQDVLRIDLAGVSRLDGAIVFVEAETEAYLDHPMVYRHVADYAWLACPQIKLEEENNTPGILEDLYQSAAKHGVGIMGVFDVNHKGRLPFHIKINSPLLPLKANIRRTVLRAFNKRGHVNIEKYFPWWGLQ